MPSVRLEPTKLMLIDTRTTYQATGDADARQKMKARTGGEKERHLLLPRFVQKMAEGKNLLRVPYCVGWKVYTR